MCGLIGYSGNQEAGTIILDILNKLEYRGYDSCGIVTTDKHRFYGTHSFDIKIAHSVDDSIGTGHTRWATHGPNSLENAQPISNEFITLAHNGIIDNVEDFSYYRKSKDDSDTKIFARYLDNCDVSTIISRINEAKGRSSFLVMFKGGTFIACNRGNPLVLGRRNGEYFFCSDLDCMSEYIDEYYITKDNENFVLVNNHLNKDVIWTKVNKSERYPTLSHQHYMFQEIMEQQSTIDKVFSNTPSLSYTNMDKILFLGCGTSYHAAMVGKMMAEDRCFDARLEYASQVSDKINCKDLTCIALSQSGETLDVINAISKLSMNTNVISICNNRYSQLANMSNTVLHLQVGKEIGVAATKTFTGQLAALIKCFGSVTDQYTLKREPLFRFNHMKDLAHTYRDAPNFLFLGSGYNFPIALEAALKLKEVSRVHAEGIQASEMKHGPIALVDENMPVMIFANDRKNFSSILANANEIKSRGGQVISVVEEGVDAFNSISSEVIHTPPSKGKYDFLFYNSFILQYFSYYMAIMRDLNPDKPRGLAKCVTV